jgi:LemA protein
MNSALCVGGIFGLVLVVALLIAALFNRLIVLRNRADNAWAQIDVQLKQRYDLIPNLVETVKGYATHERETLEKVIQARNMAVDASGVGEQAKAENVLTGALKSLFAVAEAYPDLKANVNFLDLQEKLSTIEQKIAYARQFYNDSVMTFNTSIQQFPANVIAGILGFSAKEYFEIEPAAAEAPKVQF